ncbi:hypothetical protein JKF63_06480 [Porcisia hertigi]|uniref:VWFA domain-containing protein n=1 Tax=Porcisia hertigi TaxID=2761500 RepID=A0A837AXY5_9TRYP|nr:hypothetical protein JKF63_06480 [Porcisia hertigi]
MVEACFLCLDSTEYMRNGDQYPTRMMAEQDAACILVSAKLQANAENTLGFLTTGGNACTVYETLTNNMDAIMTSIGTIPVSGKRCNFSSGLQIAALALSHRTNARAEKRIVAFVGSPVQETEAELEALAKKLRKDDVAVDVVTFGVEENVELLHGFVKKVSKKENSRFLAVPMKESLTETLMLNAILVGESANWEDTNGNTNMGGFGVDPNMDPELAMALRLSMEDEMQRQAAAAAAAATAPSAPPGGPQASGNGASVANQATPAVAVVEELDEQNYNNMSEEEMVRRAIALSLQGTAQGTADEASQPPTTSGAQRNEEETEDEFARGVEKALEEEEEKRS